MSALNSSHSGSPHFEDLDGCSEEGFGTLLGRLIDADARNFVLDFGEDQAQVAFNVREDLFPQLVERGVSTMRQDHARHDVVADSLL
jgi:hypothetical protein